MTAHHSLICRRVEHGLLTDKLLPIQFGADLWKEDVEQYDKVCKVEPFQRGLKTLNTGCMMNGRRFVSTVLNMY